MKHTIINVKNCIWILLLAWIVGFMGLLLVYSIPSQMVKTENAITTFSAEGPGPVLYGDYISTRLDNYTDSLMINTAQYDGSESIVSKALSNYHYELDGKTPFDAFVLKSETEKNEVKAVSYARYWHGYLVILKPLLCFFDYASIRMINGWVQLILMLWIILKMASSEWKEYLLPFIGMIAILNPMVISKSLQYSSIFYIILFSTLYLLYRGAEVVVNKKIWIFMLIVGILTSFFDFLTYPVVTLCVPLILLEVYEKKETEASREFVFDRCIRVAYWGIGYIGMWAGKWIIASLTIGENIIKDAILSALYRMSSGTAETGTYEKINFIMSLRKNISVFHPKIYWILAILLAVAIVVVAKLSKKHNTSLEYKKIKIIFYGIVGCIPFVWIIVMCNHSYVHYWMTFRNFAVSALAWGCMLKTIIEYFDLKKELI